jgi:hypothetical protein
MSEPLPQGAAPPVDGAAPDFYKLLVYKFSRAMSAFVDASYRVHTLPESLAEAGLVLAPDLFPIESLPPKRREKLKQEGYRVYLRTEERFKNAAAKLLECAHNKSIRRPSLYKIAMNPREWLKEMEADLIAGYGQLTRELLSLTPKNEKKRRGPKRKFDPATDKRIYDDVESSGLSPKQWANESGKNFREVQKTIKRHRENERRKTRQAQSP